MKNHSQLPKEYSYFSQKSIGRFPMTTTGREGHCTDCPLRSPSILRSVLRPPVRPLDRSMFQHPPPLPRSCTYRSAPACGRRSLSCSPTPEPLPVVKSRPTLYQRSATQAALQPQDAESRPGVQPNRQSLSLVTGHVRPCTRSGRMIWPRACPPLSAPLGRQRSVAVQQRTPKPSCAESRNSRCTARSRLWAAGRTKQRSRGISRQRF